MKYNSFIGFIYLSVLKFILFYKSVKLSMSWIFTLYKLSITNSTYITFNSFLEDNIASY